jgi:hypothetical protein
LASACCRSPIQSRRPKTWRAAKPRGGKTGTCPQCYAQRCRRGLGEQLRCETGSRARWRRAGKTEQSEARRVTNEEGLDSFETANG